jgi:hypothetical protein
MQILHTRDSVLTPRKLTEKRGCCHVDFRHQEGVFVPLFARIVVFGSGGCRKCSVAVNTWRMFAFRASALKKPQGEQAWAENYAHFRD